MYAYSISLFTPISNYRCSVLLTAWGAWADGGVGAGPPPAPFPSTPAVAEQRSPPASSSEKATGLMSELYSAPALVDPQAPSDGSPETSSSKASLPEAATPPPQEDTTKTSKRKRRSRLGELQEIRQQLAQRELELLSKERSLSARDQDISVLLEEVGPCSSHSPRLVTLTVMLYLAWKALVLHLMGIIAYVWGLGLDHTMPCRQLMHCICQLAHPRPIPLPCFCPAGD